MEKIFSPKTEHTFEPNPSLLCTIKKYFEYVLLLIPPIAMIFKERIPYESLHHFSDTTFLALFIILIPLPIVLCLTIITIKYIKHDVKTALLHYAAAGFVLPCILAGCVMVSTFIGWRGDNGSIGWFILLAVPYGIVLSLVTGIIGIVMRYILKGVQWFFRGRH